MERFPHELAVGDVYFSPLLLVVILSFLAAGLTTVIFNKLRIASYIVYPSLAFLAIMTLYIVLIDALFIKI